MKRLSKKKKAEKVSAFTKDLVEVCLKHGMGLEPYYHVYDEYDSDNGIRIVFTPETYYICTAMSD